MLLFLILLIYSNAFNSSWHFDDRPNILSNYYLHLTDLRPSSIVQTFYTRPQAADQLGKKLYRPVACLTFALNWFFGKDDPTGYHVINIAIHGLTAFLLFLTTRAIFYTPNLHGRHPERHVYLIAFLTASLWAVNPIHTQPVNYIVQRMALLASFFSLASLLAYIRVRQSTTPFKRVFGLLTCGICMSLAIGSKENAMLLPLSMVLLEFTFFQNLNQPRAKWRLLWTGAITGIFVISVASIFIAKGSLFSILTSYSDRPFTMTERLLTQSRVLFHYLSQIFYPLPQRLSIEHDVMISTSLIHPWTTLVALVAIVTIVVACIWGSKKYPLVSFPILYFFITHLVESTIVPLEMVFEHRNYLPSQFLFLPVASAAVFAVAHYQKRQNRIMQWLVGCGVALLIALMGFGTYTRNMAWKTETSLWQDAALKAPQSARPLANLGWILAYGEMARFRKYDEALSLYHMALERSMPRKRSKAMLLDNVAGVYALKKDFARAIDTLHQSLELYPEYRISRFDLSRLYLQIGDLNDALIHADHLTKKKPDNDTYQNLKGLVLLRQNRIPQALECFQLALKIDPYNLKTRMHIGYSLSRLGFYQKAEWFLKLSVNDSSGDWLPLFCLIENSMASDKRHMALQYTDVLLDRYSITFVQAQLKKLSQDHLEVPIATRVVEQTISHSVLKRFDGR